MMDNNMTFLQECARFLLETHEEKNELKQRFTNLFFETYGQQIAGDCGCSHLVFDHQLIPVRQPEFLIDLMHATLDLGVIDCSSDHLGRNLNAVFKTKFSLSTFQRKLRANTLRESILYKNQIIQGQITGLYINNQQINSKFKNGRFLSDTFFFTVLAAI